MKALQPALKDLMHQGLSSQGLQWVQRLSLYASYQCPLREHRVFPLGMCSLSQAVHAGSSGSAAKAQISDSLGGRAMLLST